MVERGSNAAPIERAVIRRALRERPSRPEEDMDWLPTLDQQVRARVRRELPAQRISAAVLVPLVDRRDGFSVLLTQRSATLRDHAGQISFPGGRIESEDADAWSAALREAHEEVGLEPRSVEFAGFLPDHLIVTGYRVTPAVGFVAPDYRLSLDASEVESAFEVPLAFLFDESNHRTRQRRLGEVEFTVYEIPYGERRIWGATAAMLMTLRSLLRPAERSAP